VLHETILRPVSCRQQTQKPHFNEFEMTGVMNLIPNQSNGISQITKLKESNILNQTRERIPAEALGRKNIAEQSLLLSLRERNLADKLENENRSRPRLMTYCPMTKT
jgi:hypothetical protein